METNLDVSSLIDVTKTLPSGVSGYLTGGGIIMVSAVFIVLFLNIKRNQGKLAPVFIGALGYVVFGFLGYNAIASLIMSISPTLKEAYEYGEAPAMIVLSLITAGMFSLGRMAVVKMMSHNDYRGIGSYYNAGLGISIGNIVFYGISIISMMVWTMGIEEQGLEMLFGAMNSEQEVIDTFESIQPLFNNEAPVWFFLALNYCMDILLYASLTWLTGCACEGKLPKIWYLYGFLMNFVAILPFDLYKGTTTTGYIVPFVVKAVILIAVIIVVNKVTGDIDRTGEGDKKLKKMPKIGNLSKL